MFVGEYLKSVLFVWKEGLLCCGGFKAQKVVDGTKGFESKFKVEIMNKTVNESGIMTNDENVIHID